MSKDTASRWGPGIRLGDTIVIPLGPPSPPVLVQIVEMTPTSVTIEPVPAFRTIEILPAGAA